MSVRSGDTPDQEPRAPWGAPIDAYAEFSPYAQRVDLWLRSHWPSSPGRPARAVSVEQGYFAYQEFEDEGVMPSPVLNMNEAEARAIYAALDRVFGEPEDRYADTEFLRSVYEREAGRVDRLMFPPPIFQPPQGPAPEST